MDRIRSIVGMARRRLFLQEWLDASWLAAAVAAGVFLALVLERRLVGISAEVGVPSAGGPWLAASVVLVIAVSALAGWLRVRRRMRTLEQAALELDARIRSGERLSTALALSADEHAASDPFARAAIADAVAYAGDPDLPGRAREAFPVRATGRWWLAPAVLAAAVAAWMLVPQRVAADAARKDEAAKASVRTATPEEKRLEELVKQVERSPELAAKLNAELETAKRTLDEGARGPVKSPEEAARESLRRMAELEQRLAEVSESKESKASRELRDSLAKLDLPKEQNAARDLAEALKTGDFEAAKKAVEDLKKAAEGADLTKEQREQLARALEQTSKQLDTLAKDPSKLADALRKAGMDPSLANNPLALQQAIAQSKSLNESQKQAIQQMSQAIQSSQSKLAQMSQQMDKMAAQCKNPGQPGKDGQEGKEGQQGKDGESMSKMLDQAEADKQMAMAAESASGQAQGGDQGSGRGAMSESDADSALRASADGEGNGKGRGEGGGKKQGSEGGRAQASGGTRQIRETAFGTKLQKEKGARSDGDVIARQLVAGQSPVGESRVQLEQVAGSIAAGYEKGSEDDPVPAHLRDVHKRYFGDLRKQFEERGVQPAKPAGSAPAPAPAPAAKSAGGAGNG